MGKIAVAIIDREDESIVRTKSLIKNFSDIEIIQASTRLSDLEMTLQETEPVIVLAGPLFSLEDLEGILKKNANSLNTVRVILLASGVNAPLLKNAIKLNVHDVLEFPFTFNDFNETAKRAKAIFEEISLKKNNGNLKKEGKKKKGARKITVFGSKGGCGKSFIAINLAVEMANRLKKRVNIFDLNYQFGDVALMLNLFPKNTIYDILSVIDQLDAEMLNSFLTTHSSGVRILPAPIDPTQDEAISTQTTKKILDVLSEISDYIIIDTPAGFTDNVLLLLEETDYLCTVASMDVTSIKNLKITLQLLEQLRFPMEKMLLILNRSDSKVGITREEIIKNINRKIDVFIPSSRVVPMSVNNGVPIITEMPRSPVSKSIAKLANILVNRMENDK